MKNLKSLIIIFTATLTLISCNKSSDDLNLQNSQELILGNWKISEFNVSDSSEMETFIYNDFYNASFNTNTLPITLSFINTAENTKFIKNYLTGSWSITNGEILLTPNENLDISSENYEITEITENTLTLRINLLKKDYLYSWYFTDFNDNDLIYITEKYTRE
jgi:hypothetical protein